MKTAQSQAPPPRPARRRGWLRKCLWIFGIVLVLVVIAGFAVTSSAFFKGVILPRVGAAMNADVTVSDVSIRPFSQVVLKDLEVKPEGRETLLTAREIRLRYSLMAILRGNLVVDEITIETPLLQVVERADGTRNLDPILASQPAAPESGPTPKPGGESEPPRIDIKKVAVSNATLRLVKNHTGGQRDLSELSAARLVLEDLKNGGAGKLDLGGVMTIDHNPPAPGTNATLQATLEGGFRFELNADLQPRVVQGDTRIEVQRAGGALGDLTALRLVLACDWSPTEIRELALRLQRTGVDLAAMTVKGPWDAGKGEGRLGVVLWGVDRQLLNLAGAPWDAQFNNTKLASTNQIELAQGGASITARGQLTASTFSVTQTGQTTPELDFGADYDVTLNQNVIELRTVRLNLTPTARARNQIDLTGKVDYTRLDAITGVLKLAAESLEVTMFHDHFAGQAAAPGATVVPEPGLPAGIETEPPAVTFPLRDFICETEIGKLQLGELEITNCMARLKVDGGRITLAPIRLSFEGEPVAGSLSCDLGVAGFTYDLKLDVEKLPLEPLVNTFMPEYRGQARGDFMGRIEIQGAGTTDASLRKNLSGQNSLILTNAAIQTGVLTNMFAVMERSPNRYVRTAWRLFEPTSIPFKILSPMLTSLSSQLSLGDLSNLPLSGMDAAASIGRGNIDMACNLWSPAFTMNVGGAVEMQSVLTNSPIRDWPVNLSLARALARKIPHLAASSPTNAAYVALPSLFKVGGTLGSPTTSFNTAAFAQWTAQSLLQGQNLGGVDAGKVVQDLTNLLGGKKPGEATDAAPPPEGAQTNAPVSPLNNLLDRLSRPKP